MPHILCPNYLLLRAGKIFQHSQWYHNIVYAFSHSGNIYFTWWFVKGISFQTWLIWGIYVEFHGGGYVRRTFWTTYSQAYQLMGRSSFKALKLRKTLSESKSRWHCELYLYIPVNKPSWLENGPGLKMEPIIKNVGINFHPAMSVYQRVLLWFTQISINSLLGGSSQLGSG